MEHPKEEHKGEKYLRLLGLAHLADEEFVHNGTTHQGRDFLNICGEEAGPYLTGFAAMSPDDPKYEAVKEALQNAISGYIAESSARPPQ